MLISPKTFRYYVTAAPQCVYPDAALGGVLNAASFDAIYVQFCKPARHAAASRRSRADAWSLIR